MEIQINGVIVSDDDKWLYEWFEYNCISPKDVIKSLNEANGEDILVKINSCGGDVYSASVIYTNLKSYSGDVTVIIEGLAASAASVIAMAGKRVKMSPTAEIMIHNPITCAKGDYRDMEHTADVLKTTRETIINAYEIKTGLAREKISEMIDNEEWFDASKALKMGFVDEILFNDKNSDVIIESSYNLPDRDELLKKYNQEIKAKRIKNAKAKLKIKALVNSNIGLAN